MRTFHNGVWIDLMDLSEPHETSGCVTYWINGGAFYLRKSHEFVLNDV